MTVPSPALCGSTTKELVKEAEKYYHCGQGSKTLPTVHRSDLTSSYGGHPGTTVKPVLLLTGQPGTGKTTLIKEAIAGLGGEVGGFYTEEIRVEGVRQGFRLVTLDRREAVLAHVDIKSRYRVGKYGVDIDGLENVGVSTLLEAADGGKLVVVDEIGRMELFSPRFCEAVLRMIESGQRMLGTIMLKPHPWADAVKQKPPVKLIEVTRANHKRVLEEVRQWLYTERED